jgi:hypothetical protein
MLINRAYELDPDFNNGALDDFFIIYYASIPAGYVPGLTVEKKQREAMRHYWLAIAKSKGASAGPFVSYAECVASKPPQKSYAAFKANLEMALAVDNSNCPSSEAELANKLAQRKARYMLDNADLYFVNTQLTVKNTEQGDK